MPYNDRMFENENTTKPRKWPMWLGWGVLIAWLSWCVVNNASKPAPPAPHVKVIVPLALKNRYGPLQTADRACHGAVVRIVAMDVAASQAAKEGIKNTWLTVRPLADDYTVQCYMSGDYSYGMHVGDIVALPGGHVSGLD